jgi:hypothetical protein
MKPFLTVKRQDLASIYDFQVQQRFALYREHRLAMDGGDYYPNHNYGERKSVHDKQEPVSLPPELWFVSVILVR